MFGIEFIKIIETTNEKSAFIHSQNLKYVLKNVNT